jgi:uncharacterized protein YcbK (DUF882 family)
MLNDGLDTTNWDYERWPNFSRAELACRHCGDIYIWPKFFDCLQRLRDNLGKPLHILSAHRCALHNARIGGAPLSQHLKMAVDINLRGHNRFRLSEAARDVGFTGLGYYVTFLHLDMGRSRHWYGGPKARELWQQH